MKKITPILLFLVSCLLGCEQGLPSGQTEGIDTLSLSQDSTRLMHPDSMERPGIVKTDSSQTNEERKQFIQGAFNVPAAMEVIYGLYDKDIECSKWVCKPHEQQFFSGKKNAEGMLHTRPAGTYMISEGGSRKALLLTETLSREKDGWEDCHACAPILGAAMFQEIDGDWFIEALKKDIDVIGAWGELPSNKLVEFGPEMHGVIFSYGFTAQGVTEGGIELVGLLNGKFEVLIDVHTNYSNEGMFADPKSDERAFGYNSELAFKDNGKGGAYDMLLRRKGRRPEDGMEGSGKVIPFDETLRFSLENGQYVLKETSEHEVE